MLATALLACALTAPPYREAFPLPATTVPQGWGVNIHWTHPQPGEVELLAASGVKWVRMDLHWAAVERKKGRYDFTAYDELIRVTERHGLRVLSILCYGNDVWQAGAPSTAESRAAFARFAEAAVQRYQGKGVLWEMWNEPNILPFWPPRPNVEDYILLAKEVGAAIRRTAPEEWYVGPATSGYDWSFLEACFAGGLLEHFDAVTVHPYRNVNPETTVPDWRRLSALIKRYQPTGKIVPIMSGEWGYTDLEHGQERQGAYAARQYLTNLASGVGLSIWYDWKDDGTDPKEREHHFGSVTHDLKPKPAYRAMAELVRHLDGFEFDRRLDTIVADHWALLLRRGDAWRLALWTTDPESRAPIVPSGLEATRLAPPLHAEAPTYFDLGSTPTALEGWSALPDLLQVEGPEALARALVRSVGELREGVEVELRDAPSDQASEPLTVRRLRVGPGWVDALTRVASELPCASYRGTAPRTLSLRVGELAQTVAVSHRAPVSWTLDVVGDAIELTVESDEPTTFSLASGSQTHRVRLMNRVARVRFPLPQPGQPFEVRSKELGLTTGRLRLVPYGLDGAAVRLDGDPKVEASLDLLHEVDPDVGPAAKVRYTWAEGWRFWALQPPAQPVVLPGTPVAVVGWLKGTGRGDVARVRYVDESGQTFQPEGFVVDWNGWRRFSMPIDPSRDAHWGGAGDGQVRGALRVDSAMLLASAGNRAGSGELSIAGLTFIVREPSP